MLKQADAAAATYFDDACNGVIEDTLDSFLGKLGEGVQELSCGQFGNASELFGQAGLDILKAAYGDWEVRRFEAAAGAAAFGTRTVSTSPKAGPAVNVALASNDGTVSASAAVGAAADFGKVQSWKEAASALASQGNYAPGASMTLATLQMVEPPVWSSLLDFLPSSGAVQTPLGELSTSPLSAELQTSQGEFSISAMAKGFVLGQIGRLGGAGILTLYRGDEGLPAISAGVWAGLLPAGASGLAVRAFAGAGLEARFEPASKAEQAPAE